MNAKRTADKLAQLMQLGRQRQATRYAGYACIGDFWGGRCESEFVSPFTESAHNVNSPVAFVLQDWAGASFFDRKIDMSSVNLGYSDWRTANKRLARLLKETYGWRFEDVFITNLFPYVKPGRMSAHISARDLDRAFEEFCWPQIEVVDPKLVVCFGDDVYDCFARHLNPTQVGAPAGSFFEFRSHIIYHQWHISARVKREVFPREWNRMKHTVPLK